MLVLFAFTDRLHLRSAAVGTGQQICIIGITDVYSLCIAFLTVQCMKRDALTAGDDRRQDRFQLIADQDRHDTADRFLQKLQQRIHRFPGGIFHMVHDIDLV